MDAMQAIRHIRTLVKASRETDDVDLMKKHLEEIDQVIDKVLKPSTETHFGHPKPPE